VKGTFVVGLALLTVFTAPASLWAKGATVKVTIRGASLAAPIEITDRSILADFNVWDGPGTYINNAEQTKGFIVDWSQGIVANPPEGLPVYDVSFYTRYSDSPPDERPVLVYVVSYAYDASTRQGYVYLPSSQLNTRSIWHGHGFEGNWLRATNAWRDVVTPLLATAKTE